MATVPTLPGITSKMIDTPRLKMHVLFSGPEGGEPVLFIHGNASSATFLEEIMLKMPPGYRCMAPDLRGYGDTEDVLIDARRGYGEWSDDIFGLADTLGYGQFDVLGHSMGGTLVLNMVADHSERIRSAIVVNPGSMYGFGGTKDLQGTPVYDDFAGSGGGTVNPDFPRLIAEGDRSEDNPQGSPRVVMNSFYWKPPFRPAREEDLLSSLLTEKIGPERYPGDMVTSPNWPFVAPGNWGPVNAMSPKYVGDSVERLVGANPKPPILWVRGESDQIVSDTSFFDLGYLGKLGFVPGWPGEEVYPSAPMVSQNRSILDRYQANGGWYREVVMENTAHSPYIEKPDEFMELMIAFLKDKV